MRTHVGMSSIQYECSEMSISAIRDIVFSVCSGPTDHPASMSITSCAKSQKRCSRKVSSNSKHWHRNGNGNKMNFRTALKSLNQNKSTAKRVPLVCMHTYKNYPLLTCHTVIPIKFNLISFTVKIAKTYSTSLWLKSYSSLVPLRARDDVTSGEKLALGRRIIVWLCQMKITEPIHGNRMTL